jgi:pSer/pThr/pTyr-binding forkhead associated (FHA) protein
MYYLVIQSGKNKGRRIALPDRDITIGRDDSCLVRLTADDVGAQHCAINATPAGPVVRDLDSPGGTLVNGKQIQHEQLLKHGDVLQVGLAQFQVSSDKLVIKKSRLDEDEVASWITEGDTSGSKLSDTSVSRPPDMWSNPWPVQKRFETLAEEAQDIIQRHLERKRHE